MNRSQFEALMKRAKTYEKLIKKEPQFLVENACKLFNADLGLLIRLAGGQQEAELLQVHPFSKTELVKKRLGSVRDWCIGHSEDPLSRDAFCSELPLIGPDEREYQGALVAFHPRRQPMNGTCYVLILYGTLTQRQFYESYHCDAAQLLLAAYKPRSVWRIDEYNIIRLLGKGGMAEVRLVERVFDNGIKKLFALKRILPEHRSNSAFVQRFLSEAKLATLFQHPNIVSVFECREAEGSLYIVMEYIAGKRLRDVVAQASKLKIQIPLHLCVKLVSDMCEGLAYVHELNDTETQKPLKAIHRDVTPENILLSWGGHLKLVDFGIAVAANRLHKTDYRFKGKAIYASPEQLAHSRRLDHRADIFALGVILFELLTGTNQWFTGSAKRRHLKSAHRLRQDMPNELVDIIAKATEPRRTHRFLSCREMQQALERSLPEKDKLTPPHTVKELLALLFGESPQDPEPEQPLDTTVVLK